MSDYFYVNDNENPRVIGDTHVGYFKVWDRCFIAAQKKPTRLHRIMMRILLGWKWCEDWRDEGSAEPEEQHGRVFKGIVVEYPSYSTYPERKGKPYFSIKYTENGQEFIGYGTYKPEVLSEYLKEFFMPSAEPENCEGCKHLGKWENEVEYGYPSPCTCCKRRAEDHFCKRRAEDHYER